MKFVSVYGLLFLLFTCSITAQVKSAEQKKGPTNLTDSKGLRNGMWWLTTAERMGEDGYTEFGHYDHGCKTGRWYKMDGETNLLSIETYKNNVRNGESRYYEKGKLTCVGNYRGVTSNNAFDTVLVVDPRTANEHLTPILAENTSQRHGSWKYYDPQTGKLLREEEYQVDNLIYHKEYAIVNTDSAAYAAHLKKLMHNKHTKAAKQKSFSYINY